MTDHRDDVFLDLGRQWEESEESGHIYLCRLSADVCEGMLALLAYRGEHYKECDMLCRASHFEEIEFIKCRL